MKLIKPSVEIIEQQPGLKGIYKQIELCGRVSHKSEDKITEESAEKFVDNMKRLGHGACLEHGTVYLTIPYDYVDVSCRLEVPIVSDVVEKYKKNPYTKWWLRDDVFSRLSFITTNYRVLLQGDYKTWEEASKNNYDKNWLDDLKYLCEPTNYHAKRISVRFICDRGVANEFVRHRKFSFLQESSRYCVYSKEKYGSQLTFIIPCWTGLDECEIKLGPNSIVDLANAIENSVGDIQEHEDLMIYFQSGLVAEDLYMKLIDKGWKAEQARNVLSLSTKTELIMTGFETDWNWFFSLRASEAGAHGVHPQATELANQLYRMMNETKNN